jgi:putative membrane protein
MNILLASTDGPDHWWFLFFPLAWLIVAIVVIRFVVMRRGWGCWPGGGRPGGHRARGILAERYARGEIGDEEYRTRLDRLGADA